MLYEYEDKLDGDFVFWSNSCGDLHHNGEYDIDKVEDLPKELQRAYNELWCEGVYGLRCYLVEFNGKYGISFEAGYGEGFADDLGITYEGFVKTVRGKAVACSNEYPEYDVIFGKDTEEWSDGSVDSVVMIIMPWDISKEKFDEVGRYFESMCYAPYDEPHQHNAVEAEKD